MTSFFYESKIFYTQPSVVSNGFGPILKVFDPIDIRQPLPPFLGGGHHNHIGGIVFGIRCGFFEPSVFTHG
jgi:hypothetical protein